MKLVYLDTETYYSAKVSLRKMTLRQYLAKTHLRVLAFAEGGAPVVAYYGEALAPALEHLRALADDPEVCFVAHNAGFDIRVLRLLHGLPQPYHVHCSLELACAAFPNQAGGYSLDSLARTLHLGAEKLSVDLERAPDPELATYCVRDVELCRAIHRLCIARLSAEELRMADLCNRAREIALSIDQAAVASAFEAFSKLAADEAQQVFAVLGEDGHEAFGHEDDDTEDARKAKREAHKLGKRYAGRGMLRSVNVGQVKSLILERLGLDLPTISRKKLNPEVLRENPEAAKVLAGVEGVNKAQSHRRTASRFRGTEVTDLEYGYARATATLRFSCPQAGGKGANWHNIPKRNKLASKALRSMFHAPEGFCIVHADFANVEYRTTGMLTGSPVVASMFAGDVLADPYLGFGEVAFQTRYTRDDPIRNALLKPSVLGLGFLMSAHRFCGELLRSFAADPKLKVSVLEDVAKQQGWTFEALPPYAKRIATEYRCPPIFAVTAYFAHKAFNDTHPENRRLSKWLVSLCESVVRSDHPADQVERMYDRWDAPDRGMLNACYVGDALGPGTRNIAITLDRWTQPTVVWRDLGMREAVRNGALMPCLTAMHPKKGYRPLTGNVVIENPAQSLARIGIVRAHLALEDLGYPYQFSIHDEIQLFVPRAPAAVCKAYDDLVRVCGPGGSIGMGYGVVIDPTEITVTSTLYETKHPDDFWPRLRAGDATPLEALP